MNLGRLTWSWRIEEGVVKMSKDFEEADILLQLDALTDWIYELEKIKERKDWEFLKSLKKMKDQIDADRTGLPPGGPVS